MKFRPSFHSVAPRFHLLAGASCAALLSHALTAGAFMLGEIRTESYLGAPLRATVPLRLEPGEYVDSKCVKAAPDRNDALGIGSITPQARVEVSETAGRIIISTRQSLAEPIVRFNLQFNCGNGFFAREYTLLLDPVEIAAPRGEAAASRPAGSAHVPEQHARPAASGTADNASGRRARHSRPSAGSARVATVRAADSRPKLRLSSAGDSGVRSSGAAGFQLKLSSELDLQRAARKLSPNQTADLRQRQQSVRTDDDMAEILRLRNQIEMLESQLLTLRQTALATLGSAPAPAAASQPAPQPVPAPASSAVDAAATTAATEALPAIPETRAAPVVSAVPRPDNGGNPLGRWADVIIWTLAGAVAIGFGYMLWLYRSQHSDNLGLPELFDDHAAEPGYRPDQPISRKLTSQKADIPPPAPRPSDIVVPDKDRWAIEEAQILLAQGWREQAVNLLLEQIDSNPYQLDIWLMLFELHHKAGNKDDFTTLAARFHNIAKGLPVWNSIRQMGQSLDPENPLYNL